MKTKLAGPGNKSNVWRRTASSSRLHVASKCSIQHVWIHSPPVYFSMYQASEARASGTRWKKRLGNLFMIRALAARDKGFHATSLKCHASVFDASDLLRDTCANFESAMSYYMDISCSTSVSERTLQHVMHAESRSASYGRFGLFAGCLRGALLLLPSLWCIDLLHAVA